MRPRRESPRKHLSAALVPCRDRQTGEPGGSCSTPCPLLRPPRRTGLLRAALPPATRDDPLDPPASCSMPCSRVGAAEQWGGGLAFFFPRPPEAAKGTPPPAEHDFKGPPTPPARFFFFLHFSHSLQQWRRAARSNGSRTCFDCAPAAFTRRARYLGSGGTPGLTQVGCPPGMAILVRQRPAAWAAMQF